MNKTQGDTITVMSPDGLKIVLGAFPTNPFVDILIQMFVMGTTADLFLFKLIFELTRQTFFYERQKSRERPPSFIIDWFRPRTLRSPWLSFCCLDFLLANQAKPRHSDSEKNVAEIKNQLKSF